jgi:transketolase
MPFRDIDELSVKTIRALSIDAVEKANSGHPGLPMGAAPMAYVLWSRFLKHHPEHSDWIDRDRFVLSAGHGSMLLYSMLHLSGYDLPMDELKRFRQWGSKTPGHPEYGHTHGVEATTGPLGQGVAMSVGMAMAERFLAAKFNKDGHPLIDHYTYTICGDGDLMEGVASEAVSLAGHLGLGKLIMLYDSNDISLDGPTNWSFTENVRGRFEACGWHTLLVKDGNNLDEIEAAIKQAQAETDKPTLIEVKTIIGYGAPHKQGTSSVHGSPLGEEEAKAAKETYAWKYETFFVPEEVRSHFAEIGKGNEQKFKDWEKAFEAFGSTHPEEAQVLVDALHHRVDVDWDSVLPNFTGGVATRDAFGKIMNAVAPHIPTLLGGSADLSGSNKTLLSNEEHFGPEHWDGRNVFYGVREHAMGAAMNGICLHGGIIPYAGTFLVFSDYLRPSIRLAALMKQPSLYVFTHDSIAVGEDGPTHEPVEQVTALRAIPGLLMFRPADATETGQALRYAMEHRDVPVAFALTRQKLPTLDEVQEHANDFDKGGYVLYESGSGTDPLIFLAAGSEVHLVLEAAKKLAEEGQAVRVVNMTSMELFHKQPESYREQVLPKAAKRRLAVEMGHPMSWYEFIGSDGKLLTVDKFGASAPGEVVMKEYGFTVENVMAIAKTL